VFARLVAPPSRDAWLSKVHDVEHIGLALDTALYLEVEPLLMSPGVGVDLHK